MNSLYSTCHALKNGLHRTYPNHRIGDRNGTRARTKRSTLDIPMELSAEISNNLIESAWAYDLSARTTIRSVTMVLEVSHIPRTSGCWVKYNDFFTLGHRGMVAWKGPIGSRNALNWFFKGYAGESELRGNAGLGYRLTLWIQAAEKAVGRLLQPGRSRTGGVRFNSSGLHAAVWAH